MAAPVIVVHYHELWLKGGNRRFFMGKLVLALRRALAEFPVMKMGQPGDRILIYLSEGAPVELIVARIARVLGVAYLAVAQPLQRGTPDDLQALCDAAWKEVEPLAFSSFAVRAKRSDKSFPAHTNEIEIRVGRHLLEKLRASGRTVRVQLNDPELTCHIEVTSGPMLVYARKIAGPGGLPANTAGRMLCLLSGGFDSAVAAYKMMRRGAHVNFVHFWGGGARPGESSVHVARQLVERLVPYQATAKLYLVPFEGIQREIVRAAPETHRILLYRRMMLRIAERLARKSHALAIVAGDSLAQVASQTLQNMVAVGAASSMTVFRPLAGDDKQQILDLARYIGTFDISAEPFHDCCPIFMPRRPALFASIEDLEQAEVGLNIPEMVTLGVKSATLEHYSFVSGRVQRREQASLATVAAGEESPRNHICR